MAVPYTFGSATTSIPLSQLDSNFATTITLGNTAIQLGNTVTTLNNMTLANVTISSGTSSIIPTSIANGTSNVTIASSSGNISLNTNGSQALLIDTNQNLAAGGATMPPNTVYPGLFLNYGVSLTGWSAKTFLSYNSYNVGTQLKYRGTDAFSGFALDGATMLWYNAASGTANTNITPVERMRIDSSGNLLVNNTATLYTGQHNIRGGDNSGTGVLTTQSATTTSYYHTVGTSSGGAFVVYAGNGSFNGAYIVWGATSWSANSDARLKNVTGTYTNALSDITQIQPVKFTWKSDKTNTPYVGVIAQSVQNVVPEAMSQNKLPSSGDETEYLGVRYTDLIPLMIASIQELKAINDTQAKTINALTARIVALENK